MKKVIRLVMLATVGMAVATTPLSAAVTSRTERDENAKQVAKAWVLSWLQGDTAVTTSLSAVPFFLALHQNLWVESQANW
jgi:hypothetical protein